MLIYPLPLYENFQKRNLDCASELSMSRLYNQRIHTARDHFFQILDDNNKEKPFNINHHTNMSKFFFLTVIEILSSSNLFPIFLFPSGLIQCYRAVIYQN